MNGTVTGLSRDYALFPHKNAASYGIEVLNKLYNTSVGVENKGVDSPLRWREYFQANTPSTSVSINPNSIAIPRVIQNESASREGMHDQTVSPLAIVYS